MKVKILLTTLLLALLSTSAIYAQDNNKSKCCSDKCARSVAYEKDCDFCSGLFHSRSHWRHESMYHHDACCSKETATKTKEVSTKHYTYDYDHSWRSHRAYWRHNHYHQDHNNEDRG
jgi:hypothetical protein